MKKKSILFGLTVGLMMLPICSVGNSNILADDFTNQKETPLEPMESSSDYSKEAGEAVLLLDEVQPYIKPYYFKTNNFFQMNGKRYGDGYTCMGYGNSSGERKGNTTVFNLQGKYKTLSFSTGVVEQGTSNNQYIVTIFKDGKISYEKTIAFNDPVISHTVDVTGCQQLIISIYSGRSAAMYDATFGVADLVVTKVNPQPNTTYRMTPSNDREAYLLDLVEPYDKPYWYDSNNSFSMGGLSYSNGFTCMGYGKNYELENMDGNITSFNLDNKFNTIKFTTGTVNFGDNKEVVFRVFKDGKLADEYKMSTYDLPVQHSLDVTNCTRLSFSVDDGRSTAMYSGTYGIADIIVEAPNAIQKPAPEPSPSTTMYRLYNSNSGEHFYTGNMTEVNYLQSIGWKYEGIGWTAPSSSQIPVYRLYNPNAGDHHYTTSAKEKDYLSTVGWKYEGIGWYSDDEETTALYRLYNPNAKKAGAHHYTTDTRERDQLAKQGWKREGIGWYGM